MCVCVSLETVLSGDVVREEVRRVLVGEGLELVQRKVPMGVVLVVFESRPDCLPQVSSLTSPPSLHYPDCLPHLTSLS